MEQIIEIPLRKLRESPVNPRKTFNEASLRELAETMMPPHGRVHQAIVVRPITQLNVEAEFEIVFGHRRSRAAAIAGLDTIPAVVRAMDDKEVAVAQAVENLQREDVSPIEEADSFNLLRREHGATIEELMQRSGKGRTYIFNSLKLAAAHDAVRQAVVDGVIGAEIAKELARVPNPLQPKALEEVTFKDFQDGKYVRVAHSFRKAKSIIAERYQLSLTKASFDLLDLQLVPGTLACDACPKRSDNEPALLDQCGSDVCTDPDCFEAKSKAHAAQVVAKALRNRQKVIDGEAASKAIRHQAWATSPLGYTLVTDPAQEDAGGNCLVTFREALERLGDAAPKTSFIVNPHKAGDLIEVLTDDEAEQVVQMLEGKAGNPEPQRGQSQARTPTSPPGAAWPAADHSTREAPNKRERTPEEQAIADNWPNIRSAILRKAAHSPRTADELLMLLERELDLGDSDFGEEVEELIGWTGDHEDRDIEQRLTLLRELSPDQLATLLVLNALQQAPYFKGHLYGWEPGSQDRHIELAKLYGVDIFDPTGVKAAEAASTPATAAQAQEGAAPKAKKSKGKKAAPVNHELPLDEPAAHAAGEEGKEVKDDAGSAGELAADEVSA